MAISAKHSEFIMLVAGGTNQSEAYSLTNPNKHLTKQTIRVEASKLAKKYAVLIEQERDKLKDIVEQAQKETVAKIADMQIMTSAQRMELLTRMANGELRIKQPIVIAGKIMEYPAEPTASDRRAAIAELNKMDGSYAAIKQDIVVNKPMIIDWNGDNNTDTEAKGSV